MRRRAGMVLAFVGWLASMLLVVGLLCTAPLSEIWSALRLVDPWFVAGAMTLASLAVVLRGLRWALLFSGQPHVSRLSIASLTFIGLGINAVLPGRVGDLARVTLAARKHRVGFAFAATTVVLERLLDGVTLLLFLAGALLSLHMVAPDRPREVLGMAVDARTLRTALRGLVGACLVLTAATSLAAIPRTRTLILSFVLRLPRWGEEVGSRLEKLFVEVERGIRAANRPAILAPLLLYSLLVWFALAGCNYLVALGMPGIEVSYSSALVITAVAIAAASVPSSPGAWGVFEAAALLSLGILGVPHDEATGVAYVFAIHFCQYLPVVALGAGAAAREHVAWRDISRARLRDGPPPSSTDKRRWGTGSDGS